MQSITKNPTLLFWYYILVNMAPSFYFLLTQPIDSFGKIVILLFPLGLYMALFSLIKNSGIALLLSLPLLVLHAFQIVLFYLYGEDVIAADMFLNVASTNSSEIGELLGSLLPSIALVLALYVPALVLAIRQWVQKNYVTQAFRRKTAWAALVVLITPLFLSNFSHHQNRETFSFSQEVYPVNALQNLAFAIDKWQKIKHYPETSKDFTFQATREAQHNTKRQIYVLVIGETGRAENWSLYGYQRDTNPKLRQQDNLLVFEDVLTQSNTTHKSVSLLLSDVKTTEYANIYERKGIMQAFKESGYTTICLSNQAENASFIEYFTKDADIYKTLRITNTKTGVTENHFDEELITLMQEQIQTTTGDLFILLHTYGSHFKYMERYPEAYRKYTPDHINNVSPSERERLVNAYDNSILYTDHFLSETIKALADTDAQTALLYSSDHGEDLMDDSRNKFLHASPTPTYYQLRIPFVMWFSDNYSKEQGKAVQAATTNRSKALSTNVVFHTLLDMAQIQSPYLDNSLSVLSNTYQERPRLYLNDQDEAVPYRKLNLKKEDFDMLQKRGIKE